MSAAIPELIDRLVPALPADDPRSTRLLQLCMRILGSRMAGGPITEGSAGELARRKLVQAGRAADALTYSDLVRRLDESDHGLRHLPATLQLLTSLLHSTSTPVPAGTTLLSRSQSSVPPAATLANGAVHAPEPDKVAASPVAASAAHAAIRRAWEVDSASGEQLSEAVLVRELLFVMQNIDGAHLKWDGGRDAFVLPSGASVPPGARQLAGRLAELGWLFRQIQAYVLVGDSKDIKDGKDGRDGVGRDGKDATAAGELASSSATLAGGGGLVPQALRHALQGELTLTLTLTLALALVLALALALTSHPHLSPSPLTLTSHLHPHPHPQPQPQPHPRPHPHPHPHPRPHPNQGELDEWYQLLAVLEAQRQTSLSLLQLTVWAAEPTQRLLLMAQLTRSCRQLRGGAMTVALERHERHGDPVVRGYVRHLMRAACVPLFAMVRVWGQG